MTDVLDDVARLGDDRALADLERAVVASVMLDQRVMRFALDVVQGSDFADPRLGVIFEGMVLMAAKREPIDVLTVSQQLVPWKVRGITAEDLHAWIGEVPTAASVGWYAEKVRDAAMRRAAQAEGVRLVQGAQGAEAPGEVVARAIERLRALGKVRESGVQVQAKLLSEILAGTDAYDWVVEELLERGDRMLLTGIEGGGKSTLVRQIAIMAASGLHPMGFYPMKPARVLVVDAENTEMQWRRSARPMVDRAAMRGALNPADVMAVAFMPRIDLTRDHDLATVHELVDEHKPDLLAIGPLYRLKMGGINNDEDAGPLLAALDTLRDRGVTLLIEAHAGHAVGAGGDRDMRPRGSSQLLGWPEFGFGLRVAKDAKSSNEYQLVRWRGDRDSRHWPTRLARGISDWPWTPTLSAAMRG